MLGRELLSELLDVILIQFRITFILQLQSEVIHWSQSFKGEGMPQCAASE